MKKRNLKQYAIYKGDELIVIGTVHECASFMGVKPSTIYWYACPAQTRRNKTGNRIVVERC